VGQTPEQVYSIALASAFAFGKGRYGIGWDGRNSSALLSRVAAASISAAGSELVLFGLVPTPVTAFGTRQMKCKLGLSVTASHNPPEYSGVKFFGNQGMELARRDEARVERALTVGARMESGSCGKIEYEQILESYIDSMVDRFEPVNEGLKLVVDCANGPGALVTPKVLSKLGHRVTVVNAQISSKFPARLPEPTPQNLSETASLVRALRADIGFAHDGDADRLVMINSAGRVVPDSLLSIIVMKSLARRAGPIILSENSSSSIEEEAFKLGLKVVRSRIGKTFTEIEGEGAFFATEPSKIVNPDWGMWEDGMYAAALVADALSRDRTLLGTTNLEPRWHYRQLNLPLSVDMVAIASKLEAEYARFGVSEVRRLDGLKLRLADGSWIMFRPSGTEAKVRIYCESVEMTKVDELIGIGKALLEERFARAKPH